METASSSPPKSDRRVLVTGAGGFLGQPAVQALLGRGWQVEAANFGPAPEGHDKARWHDLDLLDPARRARLLDETRPSHLLHLAWYAGADIYGSAENYRWAEGSLQLLEEFSRRGGSRVVFVGSCAEYDWQHGVCHERTTPLAPASPYGESKRDLGEGFAGLLAADGRPSGAWARPFFLFGPHESPRRLIASVIRSLLRGEPARCSHGRQIRDYLYSVDLADGLVTLLESDVEGAINIASGEESSIGELVQRAAALVGREELVELGAIEARADEPPLIVADVGRARDELGWSPRHELDEALEQTIDWWRARLATEASTA
jgi:nucleoside-diphosphate-sugar epimerase